MKTKHTPGPWFNEDTRVFTKHRAYYIAETQIERMSFTKRGTEAEANARLIAAAPELLRELKSAIFYIKTYGGEVTDSFSAGGNLAAIEKIIAKAEGNQE